MAKIVHFVGAQDNWGMAHTICGSMSLNNAASVQRAFALAADLKDRRRIGTRETGQVTCTVCKRVLANELPPSDTYTRGEALAGGIAAQRAHDKQEQAAIRALIGAAFGGVVVMIEDKKL